MHDLLVIGDLKLYLQSQFRIMAKYTNKSFLKMSWKFSLNLLTKLDLLMTIYT